MQTAKFMYWEDDGAWLGYFQEHPGSWTQGETLDDLKVHLKDLYRDLTSGDLPGVQMPTALTPEQWSAELRAWAASHRNLDYVEDDSRESIYTERDE